MNLGELKDYAAERVHDPNLATNVVGWINEVLLELVSVAKWKHFESDKVIATVAPYSTGTASATNGSATVTFGGGASIPAGAAGQLITLDGKTYKIAARVSAAEVTLDSPFSGDDDAALTYQVVFYSLDVPTDFSSPRMSFVSIEGSSGDAIELEYTTTRDLLEWDADEAVTNGRPRYVRLYGKKLLLSPPPDSVYHVKVFYHRKFTRVEVADVDDTELDWPEDEQYVLLQGVLAVGLEHIDDTLAAACRLRFEAGLKEAAARNNRHPGAGRGTLKKWGGGSGRSGRGAYRLPEPIG